MGHVLGYIVSGTLGVRTSFGTGGRHSTVQPKAGPKQAQAGGGGIAIHHSCILNSSQPLPNTHSLTQPLTHLVAANPTHHILIHPPASLSRPAT